MATSPRPPASGPSWLKRRSTLTAAPTTPTGLSPNLLRRKALGSPMATCTSPVVSPAPPGCIVSGTNASTIMVALQVDGDVEFEGGPRMTDMTDNPLAAKPPRAATVVPELSATSSSSRDSCCASWWALHGKVWGSAIILLGAYQFLYLALLFLLHCTEFVRGIATYVYDAFNHSWGKQRLLLDAYMGVTLGQKIFVGIFTTAGMAVIASLPFTVRRSWIHQQQRKRQECSSPGSTSGGKVLPQKRSTVGRCRRRISGVVRVQQWVSEYLSPGSAFFAYNSFVLEIIEQTFQFINLDEFGRLGRPLYLLVILTFVMLANAVASWWLTRRRTFRETYALTVFEATTDTFYGTIPLVVLLVDIVYVLNGWGRFAVLKEGGDAGEAAASYEAGSDAVLVLSQDLRVALLGGSASELTIKIFTKCWPLVSGIIRLRDLAALDPHHSLHILAADGDDSSKRQAAVPAAAGEKLSSSSSSSSSCSTTTNTFYPSTTTATAATASSPSFGQRLKRATSTSPSTWSPRRLPRWASALFIAVSAALIVFSWTSMARHACTPAAQAQPQYAYSKHCLRFAHPVFTLSPNMCTCSDIFVAGEDSVVEDIYSQLVFEKTQREERTFIRTIQVVHGAAVNTSQLDGLLTYLDEATAIRVENATITGANNTFSIPSGIGRLTRLSQLIVGLNGRQPTMVRIASEIGQLSSSLLVLKLWGVSINRVSPLDRGRAPPLSVPSELGLLSRLLQLDLTGQGLPTIPRQLEQLSNLIILVGRQNKFQARFGDTGLAKLSPHLQFLALPGCGLTGFVDESLAKLSKLAYLALQANELEGISASAFDKLTALDALTLYNNRLTASLPPALFRATTALETIDLSKQRGGPILGLPANLFETLPKLKSIQLEGVGLTHVPPRLFHATTSLQHIHLQDNALTDISLNQFESLSNLRGLHLQKNKIASLAPDQFATLSKLRTLHLNDNLLTAIDRDQFSRTTALETLHLQFNRIARLDPRVFAGWSALGDVQLASNELTDSAFLDSLAQQHTSLNQLRLDNNHVENVPATVGRLTQLTSLKLSSNRLSFLPSSLGRLMLITDLDLSLNELSVLPEALGALVGLTTLNVRHNRLLHLSASLGRLSRLAHLSIDTNQLPSLPAGLFAESSALRTLSAHTNALTEVPAQLFASTTALQEVRLYANSIAGALPGELFDNVPDLLTLDLHLNSITSLGAEAFSRNLRLTTLLLNKNALTYLPPRLLPNHTHLEELRINDNQITAVPLGFFANATGIRVLWMGNNPLQEMLDVDTFQSLGQLDTLRLENAGDGVPKTLPWRFFRNNPLLTFLHLKGNNLESIKSGAFEKNRKMRSLFLNFNKLQALPNGLLNNIEGRLQNLLLNNNRITALQPGLIRFNTKLTNLNVNSNRVAALPVELFATCTNLKYARFEDNLLQTLPDGLLDSTTKLTSLSVKLNRLTALPAGLFQTNTDLRNVNLQRNQLRSIEPGTLFGGDGLLPSLRQVLVCIGNANLSLTEAQLSKIRGLPSNDCALGPRA